MSDNKLEKLGMEIDTASDNCDHEKLEQLLRECDYDIYTQTSTKRSILFFYKANCYSALNDIEQSKHDEVWDWQQDGRVNALLCLRKAIAEDGFEQLNKGMQCKILTNIANILSTLGRTIESISYHDRVLSLIDNFAMAIGNKAISVFHYGQHLYDYGHSAVLFYHSNLLLNRFGKSPLLWDSGVQQDALDTFSDYREFSDKALLDLGFNRDVNFNQFSMGDSEDEINYRQWCLKKQLFINPLNDVMTSAIAATDVLHLPSHVYGIDEEPRFPKYFNSLKQEFIVARHMHYEFTSRDFSHYSDNDTLLYSGFDGVHFGYRNELLKNALRLSYSLFDKIALFLNDYMSLGLKTDSVNFRNIWGTRKNKKPLEIYPCFLESENWPLRGLYFLSKDLYAPDFQDVAEPEAKELHHIRKMAEHRYLGIQEYSALCDNTDYLHYITVDELEKKSLKMLRLAREGLIYLSLAMHIEESKREKERSDNVILPSVPLEPM